MRLSDDDITVWGSDRANPRYPAWKALLEDLQEHGAFANPGGRPDRTNAA